VDGTPLTIGRSPDNVLVIEDRRVSRHHGRFQARRGTLVYTDLGSTNGSRVNGIRVDELVLGEGDRLQVGDTVMVVETLPG
jgi:pSer/pThr/pTyr-binding forkhead associated (FHA) protein